MTDSATLQAGVKAQPPARALLVAWAVVALLLATCVGVAWSYVRVFAPERRSAARAPVSQFDATTMRERTTPAAVGAEQAGLLQLGSRYLGQPGTEATAHRRSSSRRGAASFPAAPAPPRTHNGQ